MTIPSNSFQSLLSDTLEHILKERENTNAIFVSKESFDAFSSQKEKKEPKCIPASIKQQEVVSPVKPPMETKKTLSSASRENVSSLSKETPTFTQTQVKADESKPHFFQEIKKAIQKTYPNVTILEQVPSDLQAKVLSEEWKHPTITADVLLLHFAESEETTQFLHNIKKAIEAHFGTAALIDVNSIEKRQAWDIVFSSKAHKLVLSPPSLYQIKGLLGYFKEIPSSEKRYLGESPLLLLSPLKDYLSRPEQKKLLWNQLCQILSP